MNWQARCRLRARRGFSVILRRAVRRGGGGPCEAWRRALQRGSKLCCRGGRRAVSIPLRGAGRRHRSNRVDPQTRRLAGREGRRRTGDDERRKRQLHRLERSRRPHLGTDRVAARRRRRLRASWRTSSRSRREVCRAEVETFLNELVSHGAIALDPPPAALGSARSTTAAARCWREAVAYLLAARLALIFHSVSAPGAAPRRLRAAVRPARRADGSARPRPSRRGSPKISAGR